MTNQYYNKILCYLDDQEIPIELHPLHSMWVVDLQQQVYYYHQNFEANHEAIDDFIRWLVTDKGCTLNKGKILGIGKMQANRMERNFGVVPHSTKTIFAGRSTRQ